MNKHTGINTEHATFEIKGRTVYLWTDGREVRQESVSFSENPNGRLVVSKSGKLSPYDALSLFSELWTYYELIGKLTAYYAQHQTTFR